MFDRLSLREKIAYCMFGTAMLSCTVLSGGINWQQCILTLIFLLLSTIFSYKHQTSLTLPLFALTILGIISVFITRGNTQTGLYEFEKFMCFTVAALYGNNLKNHIKSAKIIFYTSFIVSVAGLLAYCRLIRFDEFLFNDNSVFRLQSFIKYANVTACFLGIGYISFLEIYRQEEKRKYMYIGAAILVAMYLTFSKAFIPIFIVFSTLYVLKHKELSTIYILQNIVAILTMVFAIFVIPVNMIFLIFATIITGIVICGTEFKKLNIPIGIWLLFLVLCIISAIVAVIIRPAFLATFRQRLYYAKDAITFLNNNLLFGNGMGSWRVLQYNIQTYQYSVTYLHNGILQFLFENGILFTLIFLYLVTISIYRAIKNNHLYIAISVLLILVHSFIDCDLSFGLILTILGLYIGMTYDGKKKRIYSILSVILTASLFATNTYMLTEYIVRSGFEKAYINKDYDKASSELKVLSKICPYDAQLKVNEAAILEKTGAHIDKINIKLNEAVSLSPYDNQIYESFMNYQTSNFKNICMYYISLAPKQEKTYVLLNQYMETVKNKGYISDTEYNNLINIINQRREEEEVIDRNVQLKQTAH